MKLGVWNAECVVFEERNAERLRFIQKRDADIWILTETHDEIDLSKSHPYSTRSAPRVRSRCDMHWVGIWSRYPITEAIPCKDVRSAAALIETPIGPLLVFGTVWPWHSDTGEHPGDTAWTAWARQAPIIEQQNKLWAQLRANRPDAVLCVAGDLNMTFGGVPSYYSKDGRLAAALAMEDHDLMCTTGWQRLPSGALERPPIDHVLLPYKIATRTKVVDTWPGHPRDPSRLSDHSGLIVEIDTSDPETSQASSAQSV